VTDLAWIDAALTSARPQALNAYGRIKHATEERLRALAGGEDHILCARVGLVYGGPERGQYRLLARLASLPLLPMIGIDREVQPIHLDEVCDGLLTLALDPPAARRTVVLAGSHPLSFGAWLRMLRRSRHGRHLALLPMPTGLALAACRLSSVIPFVPTIERERVLGLAGTAPMDSAADLAALGLVLRDPARALTNCRPARRRLIAECAALLRYAAGAPVRSPGAIIRLARIVRHDPAFRHALPWPTVRWPALLRFIEPVRPAMHHGLARRLHLAAMVAETLEPPLRQPRLGTIVAQVALEALALPFRLLLSGLGA